MNPTRDRSDPLQGMSPSVLDRLIDAGPGRSVSAHGYSEEKMKKSVAKDLEDLLNSRTSDLDLPPGATELADSIFNFGLRDPYSFRAYDTNDRLALANLLEATIRKFEPRLQNIQARVGEQDEGVDRVLKFHVEAMLCVDPAPDIPFSRVVELVSGRYSVKSDEMAETR